MEQFVATLGHQNHLKLDQYIALFQCCYSFSGLTVNFGKQVKFKFTRIVFTRQSYERKLVLELQIILKFLDGELQHYWS